MIQGRNKMKLTSTFTKRALTIALSAGMILAYAGMTSNSYAAKAKSKAKTVKPTKITLKTDYSTIDVKAAAKLSVKSIKPAKASNQGCHRFQERRSHRKEKRNRKDYCNIHSK